jgi:hypothetical protein
VRYAIEQLLPSLIWCTQDASLVAEAMGFEPQALLKNLEGPWAPKATFFPEVASRCFRIF